MVAITKAANFFAIHQPRSWKRIKNTNLPNAQATDTQFAADLRFGAEPGSKAASRGTQ